MIIYTIVARTENQNKRKVSHQINIPS